MFEIWCLGTCLNVVDFQLTGSKNNINTLNDAWHASRAHCSVKYWELYEHGKVSRSFAKADIWRKRASFHAIKLVSLSFVS